MGSVEGKKCKVDDMTWNRRGTICDIAFVPIFFSSLILVNRIGKIHSVERGCDMRAIPDLGVGLIEHMDKLNVTCDSCSVVV